MDAAHARIRRERYAREFTDAEGAWNFIARGTPEDGAAFRLAHDPIVDEMFKAARAEGRERAARGVRVRRAHRAGADRAANAEPTPTATTKPKKPSPRFMGLIRVDIAALVRGAVEGDEICEIAGLGPIPVSVARELLGDAILKLVITKGVDVANVTHLGRSADRRAAGRVVVAVTDVHRRGLHPHLAARERPPRRLGQNQTHPRRRARPALRATTTTSRPTTAGRSSPAPANDPWSHPTTPATPNTEHRPMTRERPIGHARHVSEDAKNAGSS